MITCSVRFENRRTSLRQKRHHRAAIGKCPQSLVAQRLVGMVPVDCEPAIDSALAVNGFLIRIHDGRRSKNHAVVIEPILWRKISKEATLPWVAGGIGFIGSQRQLAQGGQAQYSVSRQLGQHRGLGDQQVTEDVRHFWQGMLATVALANSAPPAWLRRIILRPANIHSPVS